MDWFDDREGFNIEATKIRAEFDAHKYLPPESECVLKTKYVWF